MYIKTQISVTKIRNIKIHNNENMRLNVINLTWFICWPVLKLNNIFSCMFTIGKTTYVDFLPFYNPEGGSELNILRVIIHFKRFELLTHPICEMFLHLKNLRARYFYWLANILNIIYTLMTIFYVLLSYGNISGYFKHDCPDTTTESEIQFDLDCKHKPHEDSCYKHILVLSLLDNARD